MNARTEWLGSSFVRVVGIKRDRFVEFEFSVGDDDLMVQLVMPFPEFESFCCVHGSALLPPAEEARLAFERLKRDGAARREDYSDRPRKGGRT